MTARDEERRADSSEQKLKGTDGDRLVGETERRMSVDAKTEGEKGRDLLNARLRLESAQTVAAAVKHAFAPPPHTPHFKINPDSGALSPSTLSPTVGRKKN